MWERSMVINLNFEDIRFFISPLIYNCLQFSIIIIHLIQKSDIKFSTA
jgi:hypothetical protein